LPPLMLTTNLAPAGAAAAGVQSRHDVQDSSANKARPWVRVMVLGILSVPHCLS
jgi:hypothetical protein